MVAGGWAGLHIRGMQYDQAVSLTVNGEAVEVGPAVNVTGLLRQLSLDTGKVAVERNEEIVARSAYDGTVLQPGDRLEIVHFIGGG